MKTISKRSLAGGIAAIALVLAVLFWSGFGGGEGAHGGAGGTDASGASHDDSATADDLHAGHGAADAGGRMDGGAETDVMIMEEGVVHLDPGQVRALGVRVAQAEFAPLRREIRTTGVVTWDETRLSTVTARFGGYVERLDVDFTGQRVAKGDPLLEIYSPALVSAQEELLSAIRLETSLGGSRAPGVADRSAGLVESARRRLLLWEISPRQIDAIERSGEVRRTLTLHAPYSGFVVEKSVQAGEAIEAGRPLYRLADLSTVWVDADIYEQDLRFVRTGDTVSLGIDSWPDERFTGRVTYVHPQVRPETRSVRARIELPNPDHRIKPGMFATVHLDAEVAERALLVPRDAVLHTGTRAIVFVEEASGVYRLREVRIGAEAGARTQIVSGLREGERVVGRASFLLDADSRLMEAMEGMDMPGMNGPGSDTPENRMPSGSGAGGSSLHEGH
jgi:membrane fusion protein, copper/silver efflux system